ncbi:MAG TPA: DUF4258 domain-containing protein [Lacipirellulaceae bacterium]|nr:DUF4258 domain-containing protein [Lacipirellulaceae bacterium]HMP04808.1 DUF4258 domain-containing protein [Lacipirellulaceae bacterium]
MDYLRILWDAPDDSEGNVWHIAEHGLSIDEIEEVLANPASQGISKSTGRPVVWGYTQEGLYLIVVYEQVDNETIRVVTAYEVDEPS